MSCFDKLKEILTKDLSVKEEKYQEKNVDINAETEDLKRQIEELRKENMKYRKIQEIEEDVSDKEERILREIQLIEQDKVAIRVFCDKKLEECDKKLEELSREIRKEKLDEFYERFEEKSNLFFPKTKSSIYSADIDHVNAVLETGDLNSYKFFFRNAFLIYDKNSQEKFFWRKNFKRDKICSTAGIVIQRFKSKNS